MSLQNIGMLKNADQDAIDDLIAQAHFVRLCPFHTIQDMGTDALYLQGNRVERPVGYSPFIEARNFDPYCSRFDTAAIFFAKANMMRRDPGPGTVGHLNSPDQFRPNGVAALALKARALLYAASPLNNELGVKDWEEAAKANWEAIQIALQYGYGLLDFADYKKNFVGTTYTNEQLWGWNAGNVNYNTSSMSGIVNGVFAADKVATSGESPSQNAVDKFETKWGDPLNTQADRDAATALGHYNEQNPYVDRDPVSISMSSTIRLL